MHSLRASPLCHQDSLKHPLVTSGQATAGSSVPSGLSCAQSGDLAFCSAALLPRVLCPTTWGLLKHFLGCYKSGVKTFTCRKSFFPFYRNVFVLLLGSLSLALNYRDQNWCGKDNFPQTPNLKIRFSGTQISATAENKLYYLTLWVETSVLSDRKLQMQTYRCVIMEISSTHMFSYLCERRNATK